MKFSLYLSGLFGAVWLAFAIPAAAVTVTNHNDVGAGSLRAAIAAASPGDTITFSLPSPDTILLSTGELLIDKNLIISGPGAAALAVDGQLLSRVFHVDSGATVVISNLTVTHGKESSGFGGAGIFSQGTLTLDGVAVIANSTTSTGGGGIRNSGGGLTIQNSTISGNSTPASTSGGGILNDGDFLMDATTVSGNSTGGGGGGISHVDGTATIENSTISGNTVSNNNGSGGGIASGSIATTQVILRNVTISDNHVVGTDGFGGGISSNNDSDALLTNVTIADNSAAKGGGIGNFNSGTMTLVNSIVADSSAGGDCLTEFAAAPTDGGNNLVEDNTCGFTGGSDPLLGALADNGGPTKTHALLSGSVAIEGGNDAACPATDQRGVGRQGVHCDIGAYEFVPTPGSVQLSAATYQVREDGGTLQVTVTRTGGGDGAVSVKFSTHDGTATAGLDYSAVTQTVSFADGDMANKVINVPVTPDTVIDPDETIQVGLSDPTGGVTLGAPQQATATILDVANVPPSDEVCDNRIDDDGDGQVDCNDTDCDADPICQGIGPDGTGNDSGGCSLNPVSKVPSPVSWSLAGLLLAGTALSLHRRRALRRGALSRLTDAKKPDL